MTKVLKLMRNLSVIGLIVMIASMASSSFTEEITLTTIMPTQTTATLGDTVLMASILMDDGGAELDSSGVFVADTDGFVIINAVIAGAIAPDSWIELKIDGTGFGAGSGIGKPIAGSGMIRCFYIGIFQCVTIPIKKGQSYEVIDPGGNPNLMIDVYWTPLGS